MAPLAPILALALAVGCSAAATTPPSAVVELGAAPVCEASGAAWAPWDDGLVLVADNENGDRLFGYRIGPDGLLAAQEPLPFAGPGRLADPEAVAVAGDMVVIVGSHGRSRHCERRPKREAMTVLRWSEGALLPLARLSSAAAMDAALSSPRACVEHLFVAPAPPQAAEVCAAIIRGLSRLSADKCVPPLDIEAAAGIAGEDGAARVWLGLRQPRVDGRSVLLRLTRALDEVRFDGVALVEGGDRGVRAMTVADGWLYLVLGPGAPDFDHSHLVRLRAADLAPGMVLDVSEVADGLPPSSEGVVVAGRTAILVVDGDEAPNGRGACREPARQLRVELPLP